jgi:hypothetical protein
MKQLVWFYTIRSSHTDTSWSCQNKKTFYGAVQVISKSANCTEGEAAEYFLQSLHKKHKEAFMEAARNNGVAAPQEKKMAEEQEEVMLSEAGLGKGNSRPLLRMCKQFLRRSYLKLEYQRTAW